MRSKIMFFSMLLSSFLLVIAFQNCGSVNEAVPSGEKNDLVGAAPGSGGSEAGNTGGDVTCQAIAVPYIQLGFDFYPSSTPQNVELELNGELAYSSCLQQGPSIASLAREGHRLVFYAGFESINQMPANLDIQVYSRPNCSSPNRNLVFDIEELTPNFEQYSLCATDSVRLVIDYLVN